MCVRFSPQSSWEVAQSSYNVCHVSVQSSWEVAQSSYHVCHVCSSEPLGSSSEQLGCVSCFKLRAAGK